MRASTVLALLVSGHLVAAAGCAPSSGLPSATEQSSSRWDAVQGQTLLPPAKVAALEAALTKGITETQAAIGSLEGEIAVLDQQNAAKLGQINTLVANIESRKAEIQAAYQQKQNIALLGALFGVPALVYVSLAQMMADDAKLKQLESDLGTAKAEQAKITALLAAYAQKKSELGSRLDALHETESDLLLVLADSSHAAEVPVILEPWPELPANAKRLQLLRALLANLKDQAGTLTDIVELATELSAKLGDALVTIGAISSEADQMAEESAKDLYELLDIVTSGDPSAAAEAWLQDEVAARSKEALGVLAFPVEDYVGHIVAKKYPDLAALTEAQKQAEQDLGAALLEAIHGAGPADWGVGSGDPAEPAPPAPDPPATSQPASCQGHCGDIHPDASCFCDAACSDYDDCCQDKVEVCDG